MLTWYKLYYFGANSCNYNIYTGISLSCLYLPFGGVLGTVCVTSDIVRFIITCTSGQFFISWHCFWVFHPGRIIFSSSPSFSYIFFTFTHPHVPVFFSFFILHSLASLYAIRWKLYVLNLPQCACTFFHAVTDVYAWLVSMARIPCSWILDQNFAYLLSQSHSHYLAAGTLFFAALPANCCNPLLPSLVSWAFLEQTGSYIFKGSLCTAASLPPTMPLHQTLYKGYLCMHPSPEQSFSLLWRTAKMYLESDFKILTWLVP